MIKVPGHKPHIPPPVAPKEAAKEAKRTEEQGAKSTRAKAPVRPSIGRGPEPDARAIAVRLAALATDAKKREIAADEFERILEEVLKLTGLKEPEAAMEEASRRLQKEIELELEKIKANRELMEEAEDWQKFAELLARMGPEQAQAMLGLLKDSIREL